MKLTNLGLLIIVIIFGLGYQISGSEKISLEGRQDLVQQGNLDLLDRFAEYGHGSKAFLGLGNNLSLSGTPKKNSCQPKLQHSLWTLDTAAFFGPFQKLKIGYTFLYIYKFNQRLNLFPFHYFW